MVGLGTQSVIERADLVTPRLQVRAPRFYPNSPAPATVYWATDFGCPKIDRFFVELSTLIAAVMDE